MNESHTMCRGYIDLALPCPRRFFCLVSWSAVVAAIVISCVLHGINRVRAAESADGEKITVDELPDIPPLPDADVKDEPGLSLTIEPATPAASGAVKEVRVSRLLAAYVPWGSAAVDAYHRCNLQDDV